MPGKSVTADPENLLQQQVVAEWQVIDAMARRRFGRSSLAEEAALAVMDGLAADNWARVKSYEGKSTFKSFLKMVVARLLEDFARKKFGRLRPPAWVKALGGSWLQLFVALCQQRLTMAEAVEAVRLRCCGTPAPARALEEEGYEILSRIPQCGKHQYLEEEFSEEHMEGSGQEEQRRQGGAAEEKEQLEILSAVFLAVIGPDGAADDHLSESLLQSIARKFSKLSVELTGEEKLLLKLCYQDGLDVSAAGRLLSLNRFQAHGRLKRLLARLRNEFERVGLAAELRLLLQD